MFGKEIWPYSFQIYGFFYRQDPQKSILGISADVKKKKPLDQMTTGA